MTLRAILNSLSAARMRRPEAHTCCRAAATGAIATSGPVKATFNCACDRMVAWGALAALFFTALCSPCAAQPPDRVVAPRLPHSPFPVSTQPERIFLLNLTGASFDYRVAALSAVGVVAQRCPELATFDDAALDLSLQFDLSALLARFRDDFTGFVLAASPTGPNGPGADNGSMHVAVSLAGVLKAVVVTPETRALAEKAGLLLVQDARALRLEEAFARHRDGAS
ncbi:hypothetical protein T484DRAFT_1835439 [Baffinella frigidus]|nr:hypothetical protein T484DRAFT_1835439 [Cryptophyta sp. CCMP2293]